MPGDMENGAIARLTEREKDCLRRWLRHETAKEIALDLGISPHAVEKRLKMARAKLAVASSLDAARLLADAEGYQQAGPQPADLAAAAPATHKGFIGNRTMGEFVMILIAAIALIFALQRQHTVPPPLQNPQFVKASPERVEAYVRREFDAWDRDTSDFIELAEAPASIFAVNSGQLEGDAARRHFVINFDKDGDGKISFDEFARQVREPFLRRGIPLVPADLIAVPAGQEQAADSPLEPALSRGRVMPTPIEMRLIIATSFARIDGDGSGYIEGNESPVITPQEPAPVFRQDESGKLVDTGERVTHSVEELRANFYRAADKDGDGRVSRAEYEPWAVGNLRTSGIAPEFRQAMNAAIEPQS